MRAKEYLTRDPHEKHVYRHAAASKLDAIANILLSQLDVIALKTNKTVVNEAETIAKHLRGSAQKLRKGEISIPNIDLKKTVSELLEENVFGDNYTLSYNLIANSVGKIEFDSPQDRDLQIADALLKIGVNSDLLSEIILAGSSVVPIIQNQKGEQGVYEYIDILIEPEVSQELSKSIRDIEIQ